MTFDACGRAWFTGCLPDRPVSIVGVKCYGRDSQLGFVSRKRERLNFRSNSL